jgi:hypothetical protein
LEFDNRPTFAIPGVKSETITINDTYPGYVAAVNQVIGMAIGPVLQSVGTQTKWQRTLSMSCVVGTASSTDLNTLGDPETDFYEGAIAAKPSHVAAQRAAIVKIIDKFNPSTAAAATTTGASLNVFFTEVPTETWNPRTGAWSYTVSWVYESDRTYQFITTEPNAPYPKAYI